MTSLRWRVLGRVSVPLPTLRLVTQGGRANGKGNCRRRQARPLRHAALDDRIGRMASTRSASAGRSCGAADRSGGRAVGPEPVVGFVPGCRQKSLASGPVAQGGALRDAQQTAVAGSVDQGRSRKRAGTLAAVRLGAVPSPLVRLSRSSGAVLG